MNMNNFNTDFEKSFNKTNFSNITQFVDLLEQNGGINSQQNDFLLKKYKQDKKNSIPPELSVARTVLLLANQKLISFCIARNNLEYNDDNFSIGKIGLIKAIDRFNTDLNYTFSVYATQCIKNEIVFEEKKQARKKRSSSLPTISLDKCVNKDGEVFSLYDSIPDKRDFTQDIANEDEIKFIQNSYFKYLSKNMQFVIMSIGGMYSEPLSQPELAKLTGKTRTYINNTYLTAVSKIKAARDGEKGREYSVITKSEYEEIVSDLLNKKDGIKGKNKSELSTMSK